MKITLEELATIVLRYYPDRIKIKEKNKILDKKEFLLQTNKKQNTICTKTT